MGGEPVVNWLSATVRILLKRVDELEKRCVAKLKDVEEQRDATSQDSVSPVAVSLHDALFGEPHWNLYAPVFVPSAKGAELTSSDHHSASWVELDLGSMEFTLEDHDLSHSCEKTVGNSNKAEHGGSFIKDVVRSHVLATSVPTGINYSVHVSEPLTSTQAFFRKPSVGTWLQPIIADIWEPLDNDVHEFSEETCSNCSAVSDVSDIACNLHEFLEMEAAFDAFMTRCGYVDQYLEMVAGRSLNERGQQLVKLVEQYRDKVTDWGEIVFADKLKHDYPWLKVRDHEWHETQRLHDRSGIVEYCEQFDDNQRFSIFWAKGIRSKLVKMTSAGREKIQELDRFMSEITRKVDATEL